MKKIEIIKVLESAREELQRCTHFYASEDPQIDATKHFQTVIDLTAAIKVLSDECRLK